MDKPFIQEAFAKVPPTYERINHILTLGLDIVWRRRAVRQAAAGGGTRWADLCSGTGETAAYLVRLALPNTEVCAVDFSEPMLAVARRKPEAARMRFVLADIQALPFDDGSMDLLTMSFAARNINLSPEAFLRALREFHRVLKPGGRFVLLETSQPKGALVRRLRNGYVRLLVAAIGGGLSGQRAAYAYLAQSIPRFHAPEVLADLLRTAGFARVSFRRLLLGAAAIHEAVKGVSA